MKKHHKIPELLFLKKNKIINYQMNILQALLNPIFLNHHHRKKEGLQKVIYIKALLLTKYHSFHHNRLQELQVKYNKAFC